jgi:NAD(P)-dependent dehydrogenase (short-subunit alcohol dehydrogenase family)
MTPLQGTTGRAMVARGADGRIVNVTSSSAFRAKPSQPAYGSSKARSGSSPDRWPPSSDR